MNPPPGGSNLDLAMLASGGPMDPGMAGMMGAGMAPGMTGGMTPVPNHCCAHGAMHCTMPADPMMMMPGQDSSMMSPMMMQGSSLPPIDQQQPGNMMMGAGLYDLSAVRTPHGGIKPTKVTIDTELNDFCYTTVSEN